MAPGPSPHRAGVGEADDAVGGDPRAGAPGPRRARGWHRPWASPRTQRLVRATLRVLATVAVSLVGATVAVAVWGDTPAHIGPFDGTFSLRPTLHGGTDVQLAPLGTISLDSHDGPVGLDLRIDELREDEARRIAEDPELLASLEDDVDAQVRRAVQGLAVRTLVVAGLGGAALTALRRFRPREVAIGGLTSALLLAGGMGVAAATWRPESVAEPRYSGLLSLAPEAVGDARDVVARFDDYSAQLAALVENVAVLYQAGEGVRSFRPDSTTTRVLHVSDLHLNPQAFTLIDQIVDQFGIDVVVDTGDINDWGTSFESRFVDQVGDVTVPYLYVRGNHDSRLTAAAVADQPGAVVLEDSTATVGGLRFWGVGDPRFTPDKSREGSGDDEHQVADGFAATVREDLDAVTGPPVDVVLTHDPRTAADLGGAVPVVLAGHTHRQAIEHLGDDTLLQVEGSTGGAGLRSLQQDEPVPLTLSVLYFDTEDRVLEAIDSIVVEGVDRPDVRIDREVIRDPRDEAPRSSGSPASEGAGPDDGPGG